MEVITGGITAAKGFKAACTAAGIKYQNRLDMAMIYSTAPCRCAGTFTGNVVKAAPVLWDKDIVQYSNYVQAVVVNAGIANACTGSEGMDCCKKTAQAAGQMLLIPENAVLVASTGVIGKQIPVDRIVAGTNVLVPCLSDTKEAGTNASKAIMTTDTVNKEIAVRFLAGGKTVTIGGMCKGSGMIHPDMCTMLAFLATDLCISKELLQEALSEDVKDTFNMISVDRDTSTNDTLLLLANGLAENPEITSKEDEGYKEFKKALHIVNEYLAKKMAGDGEGATKLFEVKVVNAASKEQAVILSKSIISSNLVKAAVYGNDANWGRILCAMGYCGVQFDPYSVDLYIESAQNRLMLVKDGMAADYSEETATKILSAKEVTATADLKTGTAHATAWGCDLTYDYIKINADYRS